jgi:hypothetical protein
VGQGREMTQTLYAHKNKNKNKLKKRLAHMASSEFCFTYFFSCSTQHSNDPERVDVLAQDTFLQ